MKIATEEAAVRVHFIDPSTEQAQAVRVVLDGPGDGVLVERGPEKEGAGKPTVERFTLSEAKALAAALLLLDV